MTNDAGLCWLGGSLSFFEEHTTAVCVIARLRIQRRLLLRLPTITTLRGRRSGAAESGTHKCPWRAEAWSPGGGLTPPMGEAMACTAPHTRPRVGATTRPRSTTVSLVFWTRCQPLATPRGLSMAPKRNDCHAAYLETEPPRRTAARLSASADMRSRSSRPPPPPSRPPAALPSPHERILFP